MTTTTATLSTEAYTLVSNAPVLLTTGTPGVRMVVLDSLPPPDYLYFNFLEDENLIVPGVVTGVYAMATSPDSKLVFTELPL